jgi:hypothetical protein
MICLAGLKLLATSHKQLDNRANRAGFMFK